jgi:hypothetical protein
MRTIALTDVHVLKRIDCGSISVFLIRPAYHLLYVPPRTLRFLSRWPYSPPRRCCPCGYGVLCALSASTFLYLPLLSTSLITSKKPEYSYRGPILELWFLFSFSLRATSCSILYFSFSSSRLSLSFYTPSGFSVGPKKRGSIFC